ncbi:unnamed protein product [Anisakis simplex]|uniref:PH domain-containing protein n=1 Tax=Anisakis simplex TaxID=6269 RepID=A0A0M3J2G6_ANISI|nr:unnamed protein product [Anisakis simplex]
MNFTHQRDWQIALRQQIEEIARRNSDHKKYAEVQDRTQEMDDLVVKLRELVNTNPEEAARLHVQAVSILDETDRLIESKLPDASSCPQFTPFPMKESILRHTLRNKVMPEKTTTTMRFTTFADVEETELVELKADGVVDERKENNHKKSFGEKISNLFASENSNENGDETKRDTKRQSNKWNLFCTNKEKETHSKTGNDVRDLWKTQVSVASYFILKLFLVD